MKGAFFQEGLYFLDDWFKRINDYTVKTLELSGKVEDNYLQAVNVWKRYSLKTYDNWLSALRIRVEEKQEGGSLSGEAKQQNKRPDLKARAEEKQVLAP